MVTQEKLTRRLESAGAALLAGLFIAAYVFDAGPQLVRFALGTTLLFLAPGYLIGRLLWHRSRWTFIHWFSISACLTLFVDVVTAWVFYLLRIDAGLLVYAYASLTFLLSVVLFSGVTGIPARPFPAQTAPMRRDRGWMPAIVVFAALLAAILFFSPQTIGYGEDTLGHVAVSRAIRDSGQIVPNHESYAGDGRMGEDPRVGLLHAVIAALGQGTGSEMLDTWLRLRPFVSFLLTLSFSLFAIAVFQDYRRALLASVLFAFLYGGKAHSANMLIYPSRIGMCVCWTGVLLALQYCRSGGRDLFWTSALFLPLAAMIHVTPFINLWLTLAALCLFLALFAVEKRPLALAAGRVLATGTALAAPYLVLRFLSSYGVVNPIHRMPQNVLNLGGGWLLPDPTWTIHWFMWVGLLAIPLGLSLFRRARKDEGLMLLFGNTLVGVALTTVPPLFTLGYHALNFLALRFMMLIPHMAILAFFLSAWAGNIRRARGRAFRDLVFIGVVIALILPDAMGQSGIFMRHLTRAGEDSVSATGLRSAFRALDRAAGGPSVLLADPLTSYAAAAMTRHAVIAVPPGHSSPRDSLSIARVHDASIALNLNTPLNRAIGIMREYGVAYVMLNQTFEKPVAGYGFVIDPDRFIEQRAHFDAHPEYFEPVASVDNVYIYRLRPGPAVPVGDARTHGLPIPRACNDLPRPAEPAVFDSQFELLGARPTVFDSQFELLGARVVEREVSRGQDVHLVSCWKKLREGEFEIEYRMHVRFDLDYEKGRFWRPAWSKPYRRWLEWRRKEHYRFRVVRSPREDTLPPSRWQPGVAVDDSFAIAVPMDLAPGRYRVKICLAPRTVHPETYLSDFFRDDDRYDGVPIGWIQVR